MTGEIHGLKVLSKDVLPEFILDATFYTVTSKAKIHIFLSSKIHIVLVMQIEKKKFANVNAVIKVVDKGGFTPRNVCIYLRIYLWSDRLKEFKC